MTTIRRRTFLAAELRARVPAAAIPPLHRLRLRRDLRTPRVLEQARAHMEFLLGETRPDADLETLARAYVEWNRWRIETRWHADAFLPAVPVEGAEHLAAGRDGAIVNFLHHGPFERLGLSLAPHGAHIQMMMAPWFFTERPAPWLHQHRLNTERGCTVFSSEEGSAGVRTRLAAGELVAMATDMPGQTPVTFVGRKVLGTFGAARLAHEMGRPVLVVTSHRDDAGEPFLRMHAPLLPEQFDDPRKMLQAMLEIHEPAVLAWPEAYEEPLGKWGTPPTDVATTAA